MIITNESSELIKRASLDELGKLHRRYERGLKILNEQSDIIDLEGRIFFLMNIAERLHEKNREIYKALHKTNCQVHSCLKNSIE